MKRRSFIKNISLAGIGLSGLNTITGDNKRFDTYISNRPPITDRTYTRNRAVLHKKKGSEIMKAVRQGTEK